MNSDWIEKSLEDVSLVTMGSSPSSTSYNQEKIGLPLVQGNADIKKRFTVPRTYTSEVTKEAESGALLMTVRAPVGYVAKVNQKICLGRGVCSIQPKDIDGNYLYYYLISLENKWKTIEQGSTFTAVNSRDVKELKIKYPSRAEQEKIAKVLSLTDRKLNLIEQKLIQNNVLKKGLMQNVFSRGVGVERNNKWQPHTQYKNTKIGELPQSWDCIKLGDIADINYGKSPKGIEDSTGKYPIYGTGGVVGTSNHCVCESPSVILGRKGTIDKVQYSDNAFWCIDTTFFTSNHKKCSAQWLYFYLSLLDLRRLNEATGVPSLSRKNLENILIPIPSKTEEKFIVDLMVTLDIRTALFKEQLAEAKRLKQGLMQKLLTGKWKVSNSGVVEENSAMES